MNSKLQIMNLLTSLVRKKYFYAEFSVQFKESQIKNLISAVHMGWRFGNKPSMYNDSPPDSSSAYVYDNKTITFESDDYGREDYLILEVVEAGDFPPNTLRITQDTQNNLVGTILTLVE